MDRHDLEAALSRAGRQEYEIEGVHQPTQRPSEVPYLRKEEGRWAVGVYERGTHHTMRRFTAEDEACRFFYDLLVSTASPPSELPEDTRRLIDQLRRWRRAAWDAYRRARRAQR